MFTWTEKLNARDRFCLALWGKYIWISVRPVTHNESKLYTFYISSSDNTGRGHAPCRPRIRELQSAINGQHRECRIYLDVTIIFIRRREGWIMNVVWQVVDVVVDILVVVIIMMNRVKCPLVIIQLSHHHRVSAVSHPVAITCFRAPFTARAKLYLFLLRPVSFVVTQCMTFCNCCCSEARAIYHSPVIPQTAVMFLNCGINFRSVPPLTSACCSCAFAVRWTWKYFHHWFHAMMRQFNTFLHMGPPFCPQFWIKSDFSRRGPLGTLTDLPFRLASAPPLAWLPRFVDPAECRGRAAVGDRRQQEIELRGQQIRMISDKGSGWCPAPRLSCYRNRYSSAVNYCCRHRAGSREPRPRRGGEKPLQCKAD